MQWKLNYPLDSLCVYLFLKTILTGREDNVLKDMQEWFQLLFSKLQGVVVHIPHHYGSRDEVGLRFERRHMVTRVSTGSRGSFHQRGITQLETVSNWYLSTRQSLNDLCICHFSFVETRCQCFCSIAPVKPYRDGEIRMAPMPLKKIAKSPRQFVRAHLLFSSILPWRCNGIADNRLVIHSETLSVLWRLDLTGAYSYTVEESEGVKRDRCLKLLFKESPPMAEWSQCFDPLSAMINNLCVICIILSLMPNECCCWYICICCSHLKPICTTQPCKSHPVLPHAHVCEPNRLVCSLLLGGSLQTKKNISFSSQATNHREIIMTNIYGSWNWGLFCCSAIMSVNASRSLRTTRWDVTMFFRHSYNLLWDGNSPQTAFLATNKWVKLGQILQCETAVKWRKTKQRSLTLLRVNTIDCIYK